MPEYQAYNKRNKAWVKYHYEDGKAVFTDMKQREPRKKFKNVRVRQK